MASGEPGFTLAALKLALISASAALSISRFTWAPAAATPDSWAARTWSAVRGYPEQPAA
jgi:hypothetical protein